MTIVEGFSLCFLLFEDIKYMRTVVVVPAVLVD